MIEELGNYYKMFDGFSLQLLDLSFNHITALQPNTLVVSETVVLQLIGQLRFDFRYDIVMACKIIEWPALTVGRGNRTAEEEQSNFSSSLVKDQQRPCAALHDCTGELRWCTGQSWRLTCFRKWGQETPFNVHNGRVWDVWGARRAF